MSNDDLWKLGISSIKDLETDWGILASARSELFGCVFGRDSLITSLSLLKVYRHTGDPYFLELVRKVLLRLCELQGRTVNIENGEEPGKCIHEFRAEQHEHLTRIPSEPWFTYPDGSMRNYDSVDSTPLFLMTVYEYLSLNPRETHAIELIQAARSALDWLRESGDTNRDGFIDYRFHPDRKHGGLRVQNWMDSSESLFFERSSERPVYAIAPVEVQAYAYAALRSWSRYFAPSDAPFSRELDTDANALKRRFNNCFVLPRNNTVALAYALDGANRPLTSPRSSMAHVLWAVSKSGDEADSILDATLIPGLVRRLLSPDLYVPSAGIRTLSSRSRYFNPASYHNGSIWPHDTAIFAEGLENYGYEAEAKGVRKSLMRAYAHFKTPIELFTFSRGFKEYCEANGRGACRTQAWSAASILCGLLGLASPESFYNAPNSRNTAS